MAKIPVGKRITYRDLESSQYPNVFRYVQHPDGKTGILVEDGFQFEETSPEALEGIQAAQSAAGNAAHAADTARQAATAAAAAAANAQATADGKIQSYFQDTAPTGASIGDIWFNTGDNNKAYRWNGSTWVYARDSGITQAISAAATAQGTADGKARVYYQNEAPTGLGASDQGDLWVDTNDNNKLWAWNGSSWILAQDWYAANAAAQAAQSTANTAQSTASAAATVAASKIGIFGGLLASAPSYPKTDDYYFNTTTSKLMYYTGAAWAEATTDWAFYASAWGIAANPVFAWMKANAKAVAELASTATAVAKVMSEKQIVFALPTPPYTGYSVGDIVVLNTNMKLYRLSADGWTCTTSTTDLSGTISDAQIAAIAASKITGQVADAQLAAISAAKVTGKIVTTQITDDAITTDKIAAGAVGATEIAAGAITAGKLAVGDFSNLVQETDGSQGVWAWEGISGTGSDTDGSYLIKGAQRDYFYGPVFQCSPGDQFRIDALVNWLSGGTAGICLGIYFMKADHTYITWNAAQTITDTSAGWKTLGGVVTAPAGTVYARVWGNTEECAAPWSIWRLKNVSIRRINGATLIANGAISTDKIAANAVVAGKIAAGAVSTAALASKAVTADVADIGSLVTAFFETQYAFIDKLATVTQFSSALCNDNATPRMTIDWNNALLTLLNAAQTSKMEVSDAAIKAFRGAGVQRRYARLSQESLDFVDAPDTTPPSGEILQARIGRLGVGTNILMSGDFCSRVASQWGSIQIINPAASVQSDYIELSNGELRIAYTTGIGYIVERIWSGTAWGAESIITSSGTNRSPTYIQLSSGELHIAYRRDSDGYIVERIWSGTAWGAESVINNNSSYDPKYIIYNDGKLRIAYTRNSDFYLVERIYSGVSWSSETVINNSASAYPSYIVLIDGTMRIAYTRSSDGYIVERIFSGSSWGSEYVIDNAISSYPSYIQLVDGELHIAYRRDSDGYIVERIWSGTAWGAESVINSATSGYPTYIQLSSGELRVAYSRTSDSYLVERMLDQYSQVGTGIIERGSNPHGSYIKFGDGTLECFGAVTPASNNNSGTQYDFPYAFTSVKSFIAQANAIASGGTSSSYVTESSIVSLTAFKIKVLLHAATTISDATGVSISWTAIGRWKA